MSKIGIISYWLYVVLTKYHNERQSVVAPSTIETAVIDNNECSRVKIWLKHLFWSVTQ